jgi:hypothetical protein
LLRDGKGVWTCPVTELPVTLLIELFAQSTVRKFVLQSNKDLPQQMNISYSMTGNKNSFKILKIINRHDMKAKVPYVINLKSPIQAKYFKVRILKGKNQKDVDNVRLNKIEVYGSPLITPDNLTSVYERAKQMGLNVSGSKRNDEKEMYSDEENDNSSKQQETVKFQVIESDEDEEPKREVSSKYSVEEETTNKHENQSSTAGYSYFNLRSKL